MNSMRDLATSIFWQTFEFSEAVNAVLVHNLSTSDARRRLQKRDDQLFKAAILYVARKLTNGEHLEPSSPEWGHFQCSRVIPRCEPLLYREISQFLLEPSLFTSTSDWSLRGPAPYLGRLPPVRTLGLTLRVPTYNSAVGDSELPSAPETRAVKFTGAHQTRLVWDEALDAFQIAQGFLEVYLKLDQSEESAFLIQQAIRRTFRVSYRAESQIVNHDLCQQLNRIFFGLSKPSTKDLHTKRSASVDLDTVLGVIAGVLGEYSPKDPSKRESGGATLAIYSFLRFCKFLRLRYYWPHSESEDAPRLSVSASRAINAGYLTRRMFGSIGTVRGLNYIFKGGILPRLAGGRSFIVSGPPGAGKTALVLQKLAGIASRGGLSVYYSLEEAYELIIARLVAFNLLNLEQYLVVDLEAERQRAAQEVSSKDSDKSTTTVASAFRAVVERMGAEQPGRGLLVLLTVESRKSVLITDILDAIGEVPEQLYRWRALGLDSLNALMVEDSQGVTSVVNSRPGLREIFSAIDRNKLLAMIISEGANDEDGGLVPFLSDTFVKLSFAKESRGRLLEIKKCRSQDYHGGQHPFRIVEGAGVRVYPSVSAVRASLRYRNLSTLSEIRKIIFPEWLKVKNRHVTAVREKSAVLVYGQSNCRKTRIALQMALSRPVSTQGEKHPPASLLVITFKTTERSYEQEIRARPELWPAWQRLKHRVVRWYSPGDGISAAQVLAAIREEIKRARRRGLPVERAVFDEVEAASVSLPALREMSLFWST